MATKLEGWIPWRRPSAGCAKHPCEQSPSQHNDAACVKLRERLEAKLSMEFWVNLLMEYFEGRLMFVSRIDSR